MYWPADLVFACLLLLQKPLPHPCSSDAPSLSRQSGSTSQTSGTTAGTSRLEQRVSSGSPWDSSAEHCNRQQGSHHVHGINPESSAAVDKSQRTAAAGSGSSCAAAAAAAGGKRFGMPATVSQQAAAAVNEQVLLPRQPVLFEPAAAMTTAQQQGGHVLPDAAAGCCGQAPSGNAGSGHLALGRRSRRSMRSRQVSVCQLYMHPLSAVSC